MVSGAAGCSSSTNWTSRCRPPRPRPPPARLRPADIMVGHTGFLVFARKVALMPSAADDAGADEASDDATSALAADLAGPD